MLARAEGYLLQTVSAAGLLTRLGALSQSERAKGLGVITLRRVARGVIPESAKLAGTNQIGSA
jgi:hypothetical protein